MVHVITRKRLLEFAQRHPDAYAPLDAWYRMVKRTKFENFADLKRQFNSVDKVGSRCVFDIAGNRHRILASVHFDQSKVFVLAVMTHAEYDRWRLR